MAYSPIQMFVSAHDLHLQPILSTSKLFLLQFDLIHILYFFYDVYILKVSFINKLFSGYQPC